MDQSSIGEAHGPDAEPATADSGRRSFLRTSGLTALGAMLGMAIPFERHLPAGLLPVAFAQDAGTDFMKDKDGLTVLGDRPLNAETPAHLLDDDITPYKHLFVRMNGLVPQTALDANAEGWTLTIDGEVDTPLKLTIDELKSRFENVSSRLVIECGGNGRAFFQPGTSGNQWTMGAVGCPEWTGVRLADVLKEAGVKQTAVYTGHYGNDVHLSGDTEKVVISRGVPIEKALEEDAIIAWALNGEPLPALHGFPLRLIVPGYPASVSQKYLNRIWVRDKVHDGAKMTGDSYRLPAYPVAPGTEVPEEDMVILTEMPVKSVVTFPETGASVKANTATEVRGQAWCGKGDVAAVHISTDFGQTWQEARLDPAPNRFAWQRWRADVTLPQHGYYEVWARATDGDGISQPPLSPGWNPRGYANNIQHRIALIAEA
ncbi:DMSO/TMAO reductase YedYZ molybdopterin-dependent catalytic subunit [Amaricoccus macauensis]|uniref:DMSO/TMAO reductase YedYZ molybdopterin-dependent catalytic subunit n=1 Tax=Amaricoccus macauensis TaxID=57001 RepID=A0A840SLL2_9RHOB|nr:sulfite oxidase [Amaricoccus macauensis]MBB5220242.1 DMSO/TMAO reductase YedYZ molybdopterin-dependent catalytic subunit [Amaricoccus macauensis]